MAQTYYIDGYNVLHYSDYLTELANTDLEYARGTLINEIVPWCGSTGDNVKIVFDGQGRQAETIETEHIGTNLDVIYAPKTKTADQIIERSVYKSNKKESIIVVSADRGIVDLCMGMGSLIMSPKNFWAMVRESGSQVSQKIERDKTRTSMGSMEDRLDETVRAQLQDLKDKLDEK